MLLSHRSHPQERTGQFPEGRAGSGSGQDCFPGCERWKNKKKGTLLITEKKYSRGSIQYIYDQ